MSSLFHEAMAAADAVIDYTFGELFLVEPVAEPAATDDGDVNAPRGADPLRPPLIVTMTFQEAGAEFYPTSRGRAANTVQQRVGADITLSVLDRNLPWRPQAGDRYTRVATNVRYTATVPKPDDAGRIWIPVTVEG